VHKLDKAKTLFERLSIKDFQTQKSLYYTVGSELYRRLENHFRSRALIEKAIGETSSAKERFILENRLKDLN
jgi:predicted RNA polymerase sigma factor